MPNTLTNLAADIYKAADQVGRELVGFIPAVTINGDATTQAAKGDTIRAAFTRTPTVSTTYNPSMTIPEGTDQTVDNKTMTLDTFANVQIPWTGEDILHVNNGSGFETIYGDQIKQAMRAITNSIESAIGTAAYVASSRAFGSAGTTPFGSNFNEIAELRQILVDNGCPVDGNLSLVVNSLAGTNLRQLAQLQICCGRALCLTSRASCYANPLALPRTPRAQAPAMTSLRQARPSARPRFRSKAAPSTAPASRRAM